jgi:hypothetical protein
VEQKHPGNSRQISAIVKYNHTSRWVNSTTKDFYHNLDSKTAPLTDRRPQALVHCGVQARTSTNQCRWAGRCNCDFVNVWQNGNTITRKLTYETSGLRTNEISLAHRALQGKFPLWEDGSSPVKCTMSLITALREAICMKRPSEARRFGL